MDVYHVVSQMTIRVAGRLAVPSLLWALAACGGSNPAAPPTTTTTTTTTLPAATLADLSATVTSTEANRRINCREDVHANVKLTNHAARGVSVTGVHKVSSVVSGDCFAGSDFTYQIQPLIAAPNGTTSVMNRALYSNGSGCCTTTCGGTTCEFQETMEVVTAIGNVPAGSFKYRVTFSNCETCKSARASARHDCPSPGEAPATP